MFVWLLSSLTNIYLPTRSENIGSRYYPIAYALRLLRENPLRETYEATAALSAGYPPLVANPALLKR